MRPLAEAGYFAGLNLSLACATDHFAGNAAVCQAVARKLTVTGIRTRPETLPVAVYLRRWFAIGADGRSTFSAIISATGSPTGSVLEWVNTMLHSPDPAQAHGVYNSRVVADPALDTAMDGANESAGPEGQAVATEAATRLGLAHRLLLPLVLLVASRGYRAQLRLHPRADGVTLATCIRQGEP